MSKRQTAPDQNHEQKPADESIAKGKHMDLDAMDDALDAERRAGVTQPTGVILPSSSPQPNLSEDMQGMEMIPKTVGPPQYGSPDPASAASRLMTLEDGHPLEGLSEGTAAISEDYGRPTDFDRALSPTDDTETGVNATDGAKELANEEGVDLTQVQGTGKDGKITKSDVEDHLSAQNEGNSGGQAGDGNTQANN